MAFTAPYQIGVDEAGRGSLISRVYAAAVVLPDPVDSYMDFSGIRDSKKFHNKAVIREVAEYIKTHAVAWAVAWEDEKTIDEINILQATQRAMHACCLSVHRTLGEDVVPHLWIDGNYFNPLVVAGGTTQLPHTTVEGGDNMYANIAAASILAKTARDDYLINGLCVMHPELCVRYRIDHNMGYGARRHMDGIRAYGISPWHRRTFGICKVYSSGLGGAPPLDEELRGTLAAADAAAAAPNAPKERKARAPRRPRAAGTDEVSELATQVQTMMAEASVILKRLEALTAGTLPPPP